MKGHPTPMGVFSIIQKHKLHHSNIYSGAPMPFMQRITWSGIAMHAGVLPGYPASHGCIRMPMAFAAKMWNWTKMGARVVVTPGEITPGQIFASAARRTEGRAAAGCRHREPKLDAPPAAKADKAADAGAAASPRFRRRASNCDRASATTSRPWASRGLCATRPAPRTPAAPPATNASVTMSDASSSAANARADAERAEAKAEADEQPKR